MVDDQQVRDALNKRKAFVLENLDTVTLKKLRRQIESDLDLEADALKSHKNIISEFVDSLMTENQKTQEEAEGENEKTGDEPKPKTKKMKESKKQEKSEKKMKKAEEKEEAPAPVKSGPRVYSKKANKMRTMCRQATITIPPNIYAKNKTDAALEAALAELLGKHGLDISSGEGQVMKVKSKLQTERDLEGIDTSNIISEGRRGRRAAADAVSYKEMLKAGSDSEEEEEEEEEAEEAEGVEDEEEEDGGDNEASDVEEEEEEEGEGEDGGEETVQEEEKKEVISEEEEKEEEQKVAAPEEEQEEQDVQPPVATSPTVQEKEEDQNQEDNALKPKNVEVGQNGVVLTDIGNVEK